VGELKYVNRLHHNSKDFAISYDIAQNISISKLVKGQFRCKMNLGVNNM